MVDHGGKNVVMNNFNHIVKTVPALPGNQGSWLSVYLTLRENYVSRKRKKEEK